MKKRGPFQVLNSKTVYKNPWIEVKEDKVIRPDGTEGMFGTITYGAGVSIVALNKNLEVYLIKEYYYALDEYGIQLPSGGIDENEIALAAAKRELKEETGVVAKKWIELGKSNPLAMILKSPTIQYLALDVVEVDAPTDSLIETVKISFHDAFQMVLKSEITHAGSVIAIFRAREYLLENNLI